MQYLSRKVFAALFGFLASISVSPALAQECESQTAVELAMTAVPPQRVDALDAFKSIMNEYPNKADVIILGDSLFRNWLWAPETIKDVFGDKKVLNLALGGNRTQNVIWELDKISQKPKLNPKIVVLLIGTNHLADDEGFACPVIVATKEIIRRAHKNWPNAQIYQMGIPPRGSDFHLGDASRLKINEANAKYAAATDFLHYFSVPDSELTCGLYDQPEKLPAKPACGLPEQTCRYYKADYIHFERDTYSLVAKALSQAIEKK